MRCASTPSWPSRLRRLAAFAGEHHHGLANVHDDEAGGIGRRQGALQVGGALDAGVRGAIIDPPELARPALRRGIEHTTKQAANSRPVSGIGLTIARRLAPARHRALRQWEYLFCPDRRLAVPIFKLAAFAGA